MRDGSHFRQSKKYPHVNQEKRSASALFPLYISRKIVFIEWLLSFEAPCNLWNSEKVCDPKLLKICKMPLLEIWWSPNGDTSKDTVNIFMKAIHRSGFFFPLLWMRQPTHGIHSLQVFCVGTSANVGIHSFRKRWMMKNVVVHLDNLVHKWSYLEHWIVQVLLHEVESSGANVPLPCYVWQPSRVWRLICFSELISESKDFLFWGVQVYL